MRFLRHRPSHESWASPTRCPCTNTQLGSRTSHVTVTALNLGFFVLSFPPTDPILAAAFILACVALLAVIAVKWRRVCIL